MGSLALPLWYTIMQREREGFCALGRIPGPPPIPSHLVLMSLHPEGAVLVPLLSTAPPHPCNKRSILCPSPGLRQGCSALACLWEKELLLSLSLR